MRSHPVRLLIVVIVALIAFQVAFQPIRLNGWTPQVQPPSPRLRLGLDLQGGTRIVLEAQSRPGVEVTADKVDAAMKVIENRIDALGVAEPVLQRQGDNRILVEFPGLQDPQRAKELIGRTALLEFIDTGPQSPPRGAEFATDGKTLKLPSGQSIPLAKKVIVTGANLREASAQFAQDSLRWHVAFKFAGEGAKKFEQHTEKNVGSHLTIALDNRVISAPVIRSKIPGEGVIEGNFTADEARDLAILLRGGALPVPVVPVEERTVGPSLGRDSIDTSIRAGWIAAAMVCLFMTAYYRLPGALAGSALSIYVLLVLALFAAIGATLTLPGIAGLILSLGVAVDANVIIFEKMKEELRLGKSLRASIDAGWRRAVSTIVDSNTTTLIGAVVLLWLGSGPIRGFAVTLVVGVLVSIFSAMVVTRWLIEFFAESGFAKQIMAIAKLPAARGQSAEAAS